MTLKFKIVKRSGLTNIPVELIFWVAALTLLGTASPIVHRHAEHFTICPLANMGFNWCPGCGLGRSVIQLLHGNIQKSLQFHWLGIPAVLIIVHRVITLTSYQWKLLTD